MLPKFSIYAVIFASGFLLPVANLNEKPKQEIGEVTFEGASAFTVQRLLAIAGVKPKQNITPETIESAVARIRSAYLERGYVKSKVSVGKDSPAQQTPGKKESVNLKVTIDEGSRYFVGRTEVMGNETTNHGVVMRAAGLKPGEPYNPNRIEKWIDGLNRLGRFESVTRANIVVEVDETEHEADVLFHLKEKPGLKIRRH